jgi:hypothetical protein
MLERTSTDWAPWYVVPSDRKRSRDLLVSRVVVDTLERMGPKFPKVNPEVLEIARQWELEATGRRKIDE